uniref:ARAD1D34386p n=1 Tax=Blastobotrys adeninivorans TaxID=409370 RepID=A0A060TBD5_BLAAD
MVKTVDITETFLEPHARLAESPIYDHRNDVFAWVDIIDKKVFWMDNYSTAAGESKPSYKWAKVNSNLGVICLTKTPMVYVVGAKLGFAKLDLRNAQGNGEEVDVEYLQQVQTEDEDLRFNDGFIDPAGRFFAGSMRMFNKTPKRPGSLYCFDGEGNVSVAIEKVKTPNGIAFSRDNKTMYFNDSPEHTTYKFDYDQTTGEISNRSVFVKVEDDLEPDGMCMSEDGHLWIAQWNGNCVRRYTPEGELVEQYNFPAKRVACPCFAGPDMDELIVVAAHLELLNDKYVWAPSEDKGGEIFRVKIPGVKGVKRNIYGGDI